MFNFKTLILALLLPLTAMALLGPPEQRRQFIEGDGYRNLLSNPGLESGRQDWNLVSPASTLTVLNNSTVVAAGLRSMSFDSQGHGEHIESDEYTIPRGMWNRNCVAKVDYNWSTGLANGLWMQVIENGGAVQASTFFPPTSDWAERSIGFICPAEGTLKLRIATATDAPGDADQPVFHFDNAWLGRNLLLISDSTIKLETSSLAWSGEHRNTCNGWTVTSTSFGAFPDDSTGCTLVELINQNFGTVVTLGATQPGLVFTPKRLGNYFVCAASQFGSDNSTSTKTVNLLWNGGVVAETLWDTDAGPSTSVPVTLCGLQNVTSLAEVTLQIQVKSSSGTHFIASTTLAGQVHWQIFAIDQQFPSPIILNGVVSSSAQGVKVVSAEIDEGSGTPVVNQQDGAWIDSITDNGSGDYTLNIKSDTFSVKPNCACIAHDTTGGADCSIDITTAKSSTLIRIQVAQDGTGDADTDADIICVGQP